MPYLGEAKVVPRQRYGQKCCFIKVKEGSYVGVFYNGVFHDGVFHDGVSEYNQISQAMGENINSARNYRFTPLDLIQFFLLFINGDKKGL